ncbi:MAG: YdbL family protein [Candidatus Binatia bacterium]
MPFPTESAVTTTTVLRSAPTIAPRRPALRSLRRSSPAGRAPALLAMASFAMASLATACVTVNIYFPAPEVREAAERIVDETWGGAAAPAPGPQSSLSRSILLVAGRLLSPADAHAADMDVNVSTAAIRAIKAAMKQRAAQLKPHLGSGAVGVGKDGMLVVRDAGAADLATKASIRRLVDAENKDRDALYREIATANNYGAERVGDIRSIFAQTWKDKAEPGWWVQGADNAWKKK